MSTNHAFIPLAALLPDLSDPAIRAGYILDCTDELLWLGAERADGSPYSEDEVLEAVEARLVRQETVRLSAFGIRARAVRIAPALLLLMMCFLGGACVDGDDVPAKPLDPPGGTYTPPAAEAHAQQCTDTLEHVQPAHLAGVTRALVPSNEGWSYASDEIERYNEDLVFVDGLEWFLESNGYSLGRVQYSIALDETGALDVQCRFRTQSIVTCAELGCPAGMVDDAACLATPPLQCTCGGVMCLAQDAQ